MTWRAALWLPLLGACVGATLAVAQPLARRDLGGFSLDLPTTMTAIARGTDSRAGRLVGETMQIDYDYGLYSDPLHPRDGISGYQESQIVVNGLSARLVQWRAAQPAVTRCFVGLHVPQVESSVMGPIRLTLLAWTDDPGQIDSARSILLSLRWSPTAASRP